MVQKEEKEEGQEAPKKTEQPATESVKKKKEKHGKTEVVSDSLLSKFRPRPRVFFPVVFFVICAVLVLNHNPCSVKKKKDCGYEGISAITCQTIACFTKDGGELVKKKITLKRTKGTKFGVNAGSKDDTWVYIKGIKEGAIADHNAKLPADSEDIILAGDSISSIDGNSGSALRKSLSKTDKESVVIEIRRTTLPSYLRWIHMSSKVGPVEKLLTAPGFQTWLDTASKLSGVGFGLWFLSGYPAVSLPFYYIGLSGAVSWQLNKCCHSSKDVKPGEPHCYKGGVPKFPVIIKRIQDKGADLFAKVQKNPKSYAESLLSMPYKQWL